MIRRTFVDKTKAKKFMSYKKKEGYKQVELKEVEWLRRGIRRTEYEVICK